MSLKNSIKIQGLAFVVFAFAVALLSFYLSFAVDNTYLTIIALFIILLGVPHGSLDTLFAQELLCLDSPKKWAKFIVNYLIIALLVVIFWMLLPSVFLICFLLISCVHFADDLVAGTPQLSRILYGGIIIFLPALTYSHELARLYSFLIDTEHAKLLVSVLKLLAIPWLFGLAVVIYQLMRTNIVTSLEVLSIATLALVCTPLLAFTIYFCGMHSFRHIIRSSQFLSVTSPKLLAVSLIVPTVAVLVVAYFLWYLMRPTSIDEALVKIILVALAALTLPHMLLLSKSGFSKWLKAT